jgi:hypothetical protein
MYEDQFMKDEVISFEIDGAQFGYRPTTGGQELEWVSEYLVDETFTDPEGNERIRRKQDIGKLNRLRLTNNLVIAPYSQNWPELNPDGRWTILSKLKPKMMSKIVNKIIELESGLEDQKKKPFESSEPQGQT